ncbi:hypothetical protein NDU88_004882 [Pleurodeles waltl]|uniref:Uncharacterized protein n=1 Tax=Pleurodeles waltl TaxID=8319 RepID=A0AAV7WW16_PLEWA|nr:hypothetical protein NDU88_004882 [Pleurodeles waltl]
MTRGGPTAWGPQEPGSEPLSPARQGKPSGACGTPPARIMAQGKGDGVRLGVGRQEWALHPRPAGALTQGPVAACPARGPSGRLADPGLLGPRGGIHPQP